MSKKKRPIPIFDQPLVETHCHLDYIEQEHELSAVLSQASAVGIEQLVTIAVSPDNLDRVFDIARQHQGVSCTQGVHPHEADHYSEQVDNKLRQRAGEEQVVAIGEIGLDYFYDHSDRARQRQVFAQQCQIAIDKQLPVVIHTREADADTRDILKEYAPAMSRKGVVHCFTSGIELGEFCLEQGFHLGFTGIVTFNKAENVRDMVARTPLQQMLLETDSPYLTPVPYRGKPNAPYYLPFVAERVAEVQQKPVNEVIAQTTDNARNLFQLSSTRLLPA
jgi:TatD DNase family protein